MHTHTGSGGAVEANVTQNIKLAFFLNLAFTIIEFIGGVWAGSVAVVADAVHDLGDTLSIGAAWYLQRVAGRAKDHTFSYGYRRFSLLSALITGVVIILGVLYILVEAIPRFWQPEAPNGYAMLGLAVFGVAVNGYAAFRLSKGKTLNERMLTWHLCEDALGWVAVLVGSVLIITLGWVWMDPLLAIVLVVFILWNTWRQLLVVIKVMLQSVPEHFDADVFAEKVRAVAGVLEVHDLHAWSLDGDAHVLSMHVVVKEKAKHEEIIAMKEQIREYASEIGNYHTTIEVEIGEAEKHEGR